MNVKNKRTLKILISLIIVVSICYIIYILTISSYDERNIQTKLSDVGADLVSARK